MPDRGVLLVNLGSPESTRVDDVREYLREFLLDGCVIDAPYPIRKLIVEGFILPKRPQESARAYASIWWPEGSPLLVLGNRLRDAVAAGLDEPVVLAMRYGNPSIAAGLREFVRERGVHDIFLVPLYPHYAMATVGTVVREARRQLARLDADARLRVMPPFYDEPRYIEALAASAAPALEWEHDHLLVSYHGVPERHIKKSDPGRHCLRVEDCCNVASEAHATCYRHQVLRTTDALAHRLGLEPGTFSVAFQSKLGVDKWLAPSTSDEMQRLARSGVRRLAVICPAFVADCIETLEEIGIRGREEFVSAGGEELRLVPCMNDHPAWVETVRQYCLAGGRPNPEAVEPSALAGPDGSDVTRPARAARTAV